MLFFERNSALQAAFAAKVYKKRGWSVIPLLGNADSSRSKLPAIKWGRYQHVLPSDTDIEDWFLRQGYDGLGIVLGRVSRLVVLDFDTQALVSEFRHLYPHLLDTYTVESGLRKLPHLYYALPDDLTAHSRHIPGADFRADGSYVVAPPTSVGDAAWKLVCDVEPRVLKAADLKSIYRFLAGAASDRPQNGLNAPSRSVTGISVCETHMAQTHEDAIPGGCRNSDTFDPAAVYRARLSIGRNNALFEAAMIARDRGWPEDRVCDALANEHALQSDRLGRCEPYRLRYSEAIRTIASVYTRSPRPDVSNTGSPSGSVGIPTLQERCALSNALREWLLRHGMAAAARVWDGLLMAGMRAGTSFTERQACTLLSTFRIGRRTVMNALKTLMPDGNSLFRRTRQTPCTPEKTADAAIPAVEETTTKCDLVTGAERVKTLGRPASIYLLPDATGVAERLGVGIPTPSSRTVLTADDLSSPASYRRSLHRELVARRPGQYTRRWLAARLGVSKWTCRRYEDKLDMVVQPMYGQQPVTWTNLESLLPPTLAEAHPGTFLEVDAKRYPPLRSIAVWLLSAEKRVLYKRQEGNYYRIRGLELDYSSAIQMGGVGIPTPSPNPRKELGRSRPPHEQDNDTGYQVNPLTAAQTLDEPPPRRSQSVGIPTPAHDTGDERLLWLCPTCMKSLIQSDQPAPCVRCGSKDWESVPGLIWRDTERLKRWWQRRWRERYPGAPRRTTPLVGRYRRQPASAPEIDLTDAAEAAAQRAHQMVPGLSRRTARSLARRYGATALNRAVETTRQRTSLSNPAGFLLTLLRSEQLFYKKDGRELPAGSMGHQDWMTHMRHSQYLDFVVNGDDLLHDSQTETCMDGEGDLRIR